MNHFTLPIFWQHYRLLPKQVQQLADKNYALLRDDPHHPSLHFKKVGRKKQLWSVRVGEHYRALGLDKQEGPVWFWIHRQQEQRRAGSTIAQKQPGSRLRLRGRTLAL